MRQTFHSMTECDTTSYPYNVGKVKPFKKMIKGNTNQYFSSMGMSKMSYLQLEDSLQFEKQVRYPGKDNESLLQQECVCMKDRRLSKPNI